MWLAAKKFVAGVFMAMDKRWPKSAAHRLFTRRNESTTRFDPTHLHSIWIKFFSRWNFSKRESMKKRWISFCMRIEMLRWTKLFAQQPHALLQLPWRMMISMRNGLQRWIPHRSRPGRQGSVERRVKQDFICMLISVWFSFCNYLYFSIYCR